MRATQSTNQGVLGHLRMHTSYKLQSAKACSCLGTQACHILGKSIPPCWRLQDSGDLQEHLSCRSPVWQTEEAALNPAAFRTLVASFTAAPQLAIREVAARALVRILPAAEAPGELQTLLQTLNDREPLPHNQVRSGNACQAAQGSWIFRFYG